VVWPHPCRAAHHQRRDKRNFSSFTSPDFTVCLPAGDGKAEVVNLAFRRSFLCQVRVERQTGIPVLVAGAVISQAADNLFVANSGDLIGAVPSVIWFDRMSIFTVLPCYKPCPGRFYRHTTPDSHR
jgi:hypothetical protein